MEKYQQIAQITKSPLNVKDLCGSLLESETQKKRYNVYKNKNYEILLNGLLKNNKSQTDRQRET